MLTRIVKLRIAKDKADDFEAIFHSGKNTIRGFEGCEYLELWKEMASNEDEVIFMTHSKWIDEKFLNLYRASDFFKETWGKSKLLFAGKPEAWSVNSIDKLV
jgi:heme-degrading monooxygenase HmoA